MTNRRALIAAVVGLCAMLGQGCGSADGPGAGDAPVVELPAKTLALAVHPTTGAVLAETGSGVYVLPRGGKDAPRRLEAVFVAGNRRVAIGRRLTIAYTDDGALVGSSHPDQTDAGVPADLGFLISTDDGTTWQPLGRSEAADPHILRSAGASLYAVDFATEAFELLITNDHGRTWKTRRPPGLISDLAVDPKDPRHAVAITDNGLLVTRDQAASWRPAREDARALAWAAGGPLYFGGADGSIRASADGDSAARRRGSLGTGVAALTAGARGKLWAIGSDRTVRASTDGGRSWNVRYRLRERKA